MCIRQNLKKEDYTMKKPTLNFGQIKQYDKVFLTAEKGIDVDNVTSVAFEGETLYIAQPGGLMEYADGKMKKIAAKVSKLFSRRADFMLQLATHLQKSKKAK